MIWQTLKNWLASLRRMDGLDLPDTGRSSVEPLSDRISAALGTLGGVLPVIDFQMLALLKKLWLFNPDLAQFVSNIKNLGNTGHKLIVNAGSMQAAESAVLRLNEAAARLYDIGGGVDGLINAYLVQVAWSGALSSEDVVDFVGRRVDRVVIVPVEQIRFRFVDGRYIPFQMPNMLAAVQGAPLGMIPLNLNTYHYSAIDTVENSPYAKPPATAAVDTITGPQTDMLANIKWIAQKLGILGLVSVACTPPRQLPNETIAEYQTRAKNYLANVRKVMENSFSKGLLVHFKDQEMQHSNVASNARGSRDIWQITEEQVMSGLAMQPAFFGRTDSTTETYADVVYNLLLAQVGNMQRLVKRRQEATYRLDLRLEGLDVDAISVQFNRAHARDPLREAQAEDLHTTTAIRKAQNGIISPDEAAQELGYESAYDPELISAQPAAAAGLQSAGKVGAGRASELAVTLRFDRSAQKYRFVPPRIELAASVEADAPNVVTLKKKRAA
jgi:hypothetical protein